MTCIRLCTCDMNVYNVFRIDESLSVGKVGLLEVSPTLERSDTIGTADGNDPSLVAATYNNRWA